nr:hypothetical protein [Tanacetum cinerariifolium]
MESIFETTLKLDVQTPTFLRALSFKICLILAPQTPEINEDDGNGAENISLNLGEEEEHIEEEEEDELYRDVNINQGKGIQATLEVEDSHVTLTSVNLDGQQESSSVSSKFVTSMLNLTLDAGMESIFKTASTSVAPLPRTTPTMTPSTIATITTTSQASILPTTISSDVIQNLPNFGSLFHFDDRLRSLEENFSEVMQTNQFVGAFDRLCDEAQRENDKFLKTVDENIKKIIKEQVKDQVKALVEVYESDKIILDTYEEMVTLKRNRDDDADKDEGPSAGPDRGSKRRREGTEPESASAPSKTATRSAGRSTIGSRSRQASASKSALADEPVQTTSQIEEPSHPEFDTGAYDQPIVQSSQHPKWFSQPQKPPTPNRDWNKTLPAVHDLMKGSCKSVIELEYHLEKVFKATTDQLDWVNPEGQQYPHNLLQPLPLIPNNRGRRVIPFQFINNDLEYLRGGAYSRKYTTSITKTNATDYRHIKLIKDLVPRTM